MTLLQRETELGQLDGALRDAADGSGLVVLVRGEAGIGKSALLAEFVSLNRDTAHVLMGRCDDLITPTPLGSFWDIADAEPDLRTSLEEGDSRALSESLLELLSRSLRPTLLVIDDIHWADQATLDVVKRIGRRIAETHGLLLLAFRDEETTSEHPLMTVIGDVPVRSTLRIRLEPLTRESIGHLTREDQVDELFRLTGGNPLLVTEAIASPGETPQSITDATLRRLARLSAESRGIVELVAVVPGSCRRDVAEACLSATPADLDECERSGLLVVNTTHLSLRHELIRRAVEGSLTRSRRIELNALLLRAGEQHGEEPSRLVHYAREADDVDAIFRYAPVAAREAARAGGHREAVAFFGMLEPHMAKFEPLERAKLLEDWSLSSEALGDIARARELCLGAERIYRESEDPIALSGCLALLSRFHWRMNHPEEAFTAANEAVSLLGLTESQYEKAEALVNRALLHCYAAQLSSGGKDLAIAEQISKGLDEPALAARITAAKVWTVPWDEAAMKIALEALTQADLVGDPEASFIACGALVQFVPELHPTLWDGIVEDSLTFAGENNWQEDALAFIHLGLSQQHLYAGRLVDAEEEAREAAEIWSDIRQNMAGVPLSMMALAQSRRGSAQVRETLARLAVFDVHPPVLFGTSQVLAEAYWLYGDTPFDASAATDELELALSVEEDVIGSGELAFWLWKLDLLTDVPQDTHIGFRHQIEGDWRAAAEVWRDWQRPYHQAIALYDGDTESKLEALSILDEMGAVPLATRIRRELRKAGVNRVPLGPRATTRDNAARLTERQAEVLDLMADRLTNSEIADRLFISSRTVEHHVSAILSKLDVTSREQAVEEAHDLGVLPAV